MCERQTTLINVVVQTCCVLHILPCTFCSFPIANSAYSTMQILLVSYREFCIFYHANSSRFLSHILHILPCKFFSFPIAYAAYSTMQILHILPMQILPVSDHNFCFFDNANSVPFRVANSEYSTTTTTTFTMSCKPEIYVTLWFPTVVQVSRIETPCL